MHHKKVFIPIFSLGVVLLLTACSASKPTPTQQPLTHKPILLTMQENGSTVSLQTGEQFSLQLEGNITTGYTWEVAEIDSAFLEQVGEMEYLQKSTPAEKELTGAPGEFLFTFRALKPGKTTLRLIYHRSFEEGVAPLEAFAVTLVISA